MERIPESVFSTPHVRHNTLIQWDNIGLSVFTHPTMARFEIQQSSKLQLTLYSGLALVGQ